MNTTPSKKQLRYYEEVYQLFKLPPGQVEIPMDKLIRLFESSGLAKAQLKNIWQMAFSDSVLNRKNFYTALEYLTLAQNGKELNQENIELVRTELPLPRFNIKNINYDAFQNYTEKSEIKNEVNSYEILLSNVSKYEELAKKNMESDVVKKLSSSNAKSFFSSFDLHHSILAEIWNLCDTGTKGQLDEGEVILSLHFIFMYLKHIPLPLELDSHFRSFAREYGKTAEIKQPPKRVVSQSSNEQHKVLEDVPRSNVNVRNSLRFSTLIERKKEPSDLASLTQLIERLDASTRKIKNNNNVYFTEMNNLSKKKENLLIKMNDLVYSIKANMNKLKTNEVEMKRSLSLLIENTPEKAKEDTDNTTETMFNDLCKKMEKVCMKDFESLINDIRLSDVRTSSNLGSEKNVNEDGIDSDETEDKKESNIFNTEPENTETIKEEEPIKEEPVLEEPKEKNTDEGEFINAFDNKPELFTADFNFDNFESNSDPFGTEPLPETQVKFNDDFDF